MFPQLNPDARSSFAPSFSKSYQKHEKYKQVEISKELVRILRHGKYLTQKMDYDGWIAVEDIISNRRFIDACERVLSVDDIIYLVESSDKQRFTLDTLYGTLYIKATQGHTIKVKNESLRPLTDPDKYHCFHGTTFEAWELIQQSGLNRMKRNHIHFAIGLPYDVNVVSGMRNNSEVAIQMNLKKAMEDGFKFFMSLNDVILCEGDRKGRIHPKYFARVIDRRSGEEIDFTIPPDFNDGPTVSRKKEDRWDFESRSKGKLRSQPHREESSQSGFCKSVENQSGTGKLSSDSRNRSNDSRDNSESLEKDSDEQRGRLTDLKKSSNHSTRHLSNPRKRTSKSGEQPSDFKKCKPDSRSSQQQFDWQHHNRHAYSHRR